ncbi:MAG: arginase family protein [Pseudomonadota bacterium]
MRPADRTFCDVPSVALDPDRPEANECLLAALDAVILSAAHGTPYAPGTPSHAAGAPEALRTALAWYAMGRTQIDMDTGLPVMGQTRVADAGEIPGTLDDGPANRAAITKAIRAVREGGAVPVLLGGDDSTPIPFLEAFRGQDLWIVQVDAHIDWRDAVEGETHGFSSTMRRASEMAHIRGIVQIGARGPGSAREGDVADALAWGAKLYPMRDVHAEGLEAALAEVPEDAAVVLAFDVDALDPALNPGVLLPAFGGLSYPQALEAIETLASRASIVGACFVEYVPERDPAGLGGQAIARIICNLLARLA